MKKFKLYNGLNGKLIVTTDLPQRQRKLLMNNIDAEFPNTPLLCSSRELAPDEVLDSLKLLNKGN